MGRTFAEFQLGAGDLSAIRFGISPGYELVHAVRAVSRPEYSPLQRAWRGELRRPVPTEALRLLALVCGAEGSTPDFLTATPAGEMSPAEEVDRLRGVPDERLRADLAAMATRATGSRRDVLTQMVASPRRAGTAIIAAWEQVWAAVMAPFWPQLRQLLRADLALRARRIGEAGLAGMASGLRSTVSWSHQAVRVEISRQLEIDCGGSGLVLVPSAMTPPCGCAVLVDDSSPATIFYPAHGVSESWHRDHAEMSEALSALLGTGRARLLLDLQHPLSTSESASRAGLAVSTASHHLSVLRRAGLVDSRREGTRVMHSRTARGDGLLGAG